MKKKIAITTLIGELNYGNKLQIYALQQIIKNNLDAEVYTFSHDSFLSNCKSGFARKLVNNLRQKKYKKAKCYTEFDKYINFDNTEYNHSDLNSLNKKYDFFVTGSDQVFNIEMNLDINSHVLAGIDNAKKISYSASVGKDSLTDKEIAIFKKYLNKFSEISVREKQSVPMLKNYLSVPVDYHVDPTLCLSPQEWEVVEKRPKAFPKTKYVFVYILGNKTSQYNNFIAKISKENNLEIVDLNNQSSKYYRCGPSEFLYLIQHSELVLTDSFHAIVFSILFRRPFLHMLRQDTLSDMSMRIKNLEEIFNTHFETPDNYDSENLFKFKVKDIDKILEKEKNRSIEYLRRVISNRKIYNSLKDKDFNCSGCGLCANICPKGAITYKLNEKGFIAPIINEDKCVHCGLCAKSCSELQTYSKLDFNFGIYAYKNKEQKHTNSSTIGLVNILAESIIKKGGVVFGVPYSKTSNKFVKITSLSDLNRLRGSKYYQADITKTYREIQELLSQNIKVMVCATPCQIAGLHGKLGDNKNLFLVQVLCHGVPSYKLFKKTCEEKYGFLPDHVNFRFHQPTWDNFSVKYIFGDNEKTILSSEETWMKLFLSNIALNDCCYTCNYAGKNTGADIIVGDCWGIKRINKKFYDKNGVSIVFPSTEKGEEALKGVNENFSKYKIPQAKYNLCNQNLFECANNLKDINNQLEFFEKLKTMSVNEAFLNIYSSQVRENGPLSFKQKLKRKIKNIIKKIIRY